LSYEVIARKWRPQTFDEVCGQSHVTTPLRNAIRTNRVPHAILLTGPRGTGKTTMARILARCLNCEKGPTETPCGTCVECREISSGRSTDVQEIDAASRTGVDDARAISEAIRYAAAPGKHRIFIIDEVHMLSKPAFNALLKTLEEPPPSSLFVFATTDPDKIPITVQSRCQRYDLRRIPIVEVVANLRGIADSEGIHISDASLRLIALEGDGSMRDAQTLFDQVLSYGGSDVQDETVTDVLDLTDRRVLVDILTACVDSDPSAALSACGRANSVGNEAGRLARELVQLLRDLVVLRLAPDAKNLVEGSDEELADLRALAGRSDPARLRRMFRALVKEQEDLKHAPQPFAVLEMAVVRLATMPAGDEVATLLARLDALERQLRSSGGGSGGAGGGSLAAGGSPGGGGFDRSKRAPRASQDAAPRDEPPASPTLSPATDRSDYLNPAPCEGSQPVSEHSSPSHGPATTPPPGAPLAVVFDRLQGFAQQNNRGLFASLEGGQLLERSEHSLRLCVRSSFHAKRLRDRIDEFGSVCEAFFGREMRIEIEATDEAAGSANGPSSAPERRRAEARRLRHEALNHPAVNLALEELQGQIVEIRPLGGGAR
jgi:DNA polymerase-3 subunit gamma/tau